MKDDYSKTSLEIKDNTEDDSRFLNKYTTVFKNYMKDISEKRKQVFINNNIDLIDNIDFASKVRSCEDISVQTQNAMRKYIHSLCLDWERIYQKKIQIHFLSLNKKKRQFVRRR